MKISQLERKRIFRLFARGLTPEQVIETLNNSMAQTIRKPIDTSRAERLFEEYMELPIGEKLRLTLLAECVSNRPHRLMDDISDLRRIDALLGEADEKTLVSLLDLKRKIRERMAKEYTPGLESQPNPDDDEIENEIDRYYEKIFGNPPSQE
ncbi:MAG: hypothetical protein JSV16_16460 [Candidatus Hydrogenedentota bacterium]|nr:MAG: hypothetical protein JSV16_16460 [Candidatus Hydrogenedentota bacterium]